MKHLGVVYDVGLRFSPDVLSVEPFDPALAEHDINVIANDLHANAIRIEGEVIERLVVAANLAHKAGLTVFFNPWKMNASIDETREYLAAAAVEAEKLRADGVDIVLVVGCELSIFTDGIYPGESFMERGMWMASRQGDTSGSAALEERAVVLNEALALFAKTVRERFSGPVTYSAGLWEAVDWEPFDIVGLDYYRHAESDEDYVAGLDRHLGQGKPVIVMEVGCCKYEGAGPAGDGGFVVLFEAADPDDPGQFRSGAVPVRSEAEQARYLETQLRLLETTDVAGAFVFEFSKPALPTGEGRRDVDVANFAIVKTWPQGDPRAEQMPPWAPTEGFHRVAEVFSDLATTTTPTNERRGLSSPSPDDEGV